jgi:hypothetical protein
MQCSACNTDIVLVLHSSLLQLGSFTDWLQRHPGLVRSIVINAGSLLLIDDKVHGLQKEAHYRTASRLLQQALQLAALPQANTVSAAAGAAAAGIQTPQQQQQQQQGLQVVSLSSSCLAKPGALGILAALPAHSLTHLDLTFNSCVVDASLVSAALMRLSSLQELHLKRCLATRVTGSCAPAIMQLSRLTSLRLEGCHWCGSGEQLQQLLAQPLPLRQLVLHNDSRYAPAGA